jgi:hypothetical protein
MEGSGLDSGLGEQPGTPQRGETTSLLASPHSAQHGALAPAKPGGSSQRTKLLLEQLSAANQTLATQNESYRTGKSPWSAAQAAAQAATRFASVTSPSGPSLNRAVAAAAAAAAAAPATAPLTEAKTTTGEATHGSLTVDHRPAPAEGYPGRPRRKTTTMGKAGVAEDVKLKLFAVIEQGADLPIMDLMSSDPYVKVWHQESTPPQQPDSHSELNPGTRKLPCTTSSSSIAPVEFKSTSLTHLGQSPCIRESLNPIWRFRVEHTITLRPGQLLDKGWLCVEVWDYDRVGNDDPMGRLDIALEECEEDVMIDRWYKLGWVPGQTHPGPGEKSRVKVRLLMSSLPDGLSGPQQWMLSSYDFVEVREIITAHQYKAESQVDELKDRAMMSRCEWHLYEIINEAFAIFDVDGDGFIQPVELMHVMGVLGEELDHDEIAEMIAECKAWGQPARESLENGLVADPSVDSQPQVFSPVAVDKLDFSKDKSGRSQTCINAEEFRNMLTEYWVSRKFGSKSYGAVNDIKFRRMPKWGLKDRRKSQDFAGASPAAAELWSATELSSVLDQASLQAMPPVPGWMADIAAGHTRMTDDKRVPEMFWFFLRRKIEQVRAHLLRVSILFANSFREHVNGETWKKRCTDA